MVEGLRALVGDLQLQLQQAVAAVGVPAAAPDGPFCGPLRHDIDPAFVQLREDNTDNFEAVLDNDIEME
ncbi:hypothetical protein ATERTT37_007052 [Aspergillus terreus]